MLLATMLWLCTEAQAQNWILMTSGQGIWADEMVSAIGDSIVYRQKGMLNAVPKSRVVLTDMGGVGITEYRPEFLSPIDTADIHGFVLDKGCSVYVPLDSEIPYEVAGAKRLRQLIAEGGFWRVANSPSEAHCILRYMVETKGTDAGKVHVLTRDSLVDMNLAFVLYECTLTASSGFVRAGKTPEANIKAVDKYYDTMLRPLQEYIAENKLHRSKKGRLLRDRLFRM